MLNLTIKIRLWSGLGSHQRELAADGRRDVPRQ